MPNKNFRPNAFLILKYPRPVMITMPEPIKAEVVVSAIGLKWDTVADRKLHKDDYSTLLVRLERNLPQRRGFKGGVFYAQIHRGKLTPQGTNLEDDLALIIHPSRKPDDICIKNLRLTVGEYAGDDLKSATIDAYHQRMSEVLGERKK